MAGLWSGITQGEWVDDPALNEQRRMGALGAAAALLDTHGKTGGELLSGAVRGFVGGNQAERAFQLKERDVNSDIAYKRALAAQSEKEWGAKILEHAKRLYDMDLKAWQIGVGAAFDANPNTPANRLPPQPNPRDYIPRAEADWRAVQTRGQGGGAPGSPDAGGFNQFGRPVDPVKDWGAPGAIGPSAGSAPQPGAQNAPGAVSGAPGGMPPPGPMRTAEPAAPPQQPPGSALFDPNTPSGLAVPNPPPGGILKTAGPVMPGDGTILMPTRETQPNGPIAPPLGTHGPASDAHAARHP